MCSGIQYLLQLHAVVHTLTPSPLQSLLTMGHPTRLFSSRTVHTLSLFYQVLELLCKLVYLFLLFEDVNFDGCLPLIEKV